MSHRTVWMVMCPLRFSKGDIKVTFRIFFELPDNMNLGEWLERSYITATLNCSISKLFNSLKV